MAPYEHANNSSNDGTASYAALNSNNPSNYNPAKSATRPWYKKPLVLGGIGLITAAVIAGAVAGGVVGSRNNTHSSSNASKNGSSSDGGGNETGGGTGPPVAPSFSNNATLSCGADPGLPVSGNGAGTATYPIRPDHPRLFAPSYKWECLPNLIAHDSYLKAWNDTIFQNATVFYNEPPTPYVVDPPNEAAEADGGYGGSGVLDVARQVQLKIKHWAYAYRMTNDTRWAERVWTEVLAASGNDSAVPFGNASNRWNTDHFLDTAEFTAAFAFAYDWLYDYWTADQRAAIRATMIEYGLSRRVAQTWWWEAAHGNWNCVSNGGMILGALAIAGDDTTGTAQNVLTTSIPNMAGFCSFGVGDDGTWSETSDYWYFGSTGHAQAASGLLTATGNDYGLLTTNPNFNKTGLFHMYGYGNVEKFNWGDCGPNKYTATANCMMFYGSYFQQPMYTLFQRTKPDVAEPLGMFWYDPTATGDYWYNLPLDRNFDNQTTAWTSMRSSWTNLDSLYVAMKGGRAIGHETHSDIDAGDFVLEAMGERWAGELCQNDYLGAGYFSNENQDSQRWLYYRCATEGQNTLLLNGENQNVNNFGPSTFASTNTVQTQRTDFKAANGSNAFWWTDLSQQYNGTQIHRGIRMANSRSQVILQDEITNSASSVQFRMHTNATVNANGQSATLTLDNKTMQVDLVVAPGGPSLSFGTAEPVRLATDPPLPAGSPDLPNPGVTVLTIDIPAGSASYYVLFTPKWPSDAGAAASVSTSNIDFIPLNNWSIDSHP